MKEKLYNVSRKGGKEKRKKTDRRAKGTEILPYDSPGSVANEQRRNY